MQADRTASLINERLSDCRARVEEDVKCTVFTSDVFYVLGIAVYSNQRNGGQVQLCLSEETENILLKRPPPLKPSPPYTPQTI